MKLPSLKTNEALIAGSITLVLLSAITFHFYQFTKAPEIHNAKEAADFIKKHVANKKKIPIVDIPFFASIQQLADMEIFTSKYLKDEPIAVVPYGNMTDLPNCAHYQWMVLMPFDEMSARVYKVDNKGKVVVQHNDADLYQFAKLKSAYERSSDFIWNLPENKSALEHAKLIEEAKRNGSKCTYY